MGNIIVNDKMPKFVTANEAAMDRSLGRMAIDIERMSKEQVPLKQGLLRASGYHIRTGRLLYRMGYRKVYAAYQEFGGDGRRIVRHYTYAGRKAHYLRDSGMAIASRAVDYFRAEGGSIRV